MAKQRPIATDARVVEDHPVHNKPTLDDRGAAALRIWSAAPELHQHMMDKDMDTTDAVNAAVPRRK